MSRHQRSPKEATHEDAEQQGTSPKAHEEDCIATSQACEAERGCNKIGRQDARGTPVGKAFRHRGYYIKQACHRYPDAEAPQWNNHQ
tara:strand:+ start:6824 stop:7084 length:261 start_codon:yes stop_codon:yes gene_type:complete